jgi:hypothetical protein
MQNAAPITRPNLLTPIIDGQTDVTAWSSLALIEGLALRRR